jgi:hypothetical protein
MTSTRCYERGSKTLVGLIFAGLFAIQPGYADTVTDSTALDSVTTQVADTAPPIGAASAVLPADSIGAVPFDPFADGEQPVEIDPALVPPPAQ